VTIDLNVRFVDDGKHAQIIHLLNQIFNQGTQIMATVKEVTDDYNAIKKILTDKLAADAVNQKALQDQIDALTASGVDATALQTLKDEMDADLAAIQPPVPTP
jgi:hypothetical protein